MPGTNFKNKGLGRSVSSDGSESTRQKPSSKDSACSPVSDNGYKADDAKSAKKTYCIPPRFSSLGRIPSVHSPSTSSESASISQNRPLSNVTEVNLTELQRQFNPNLDAARARPIKISTPNRANSTLSTVADKSASVVTSSSDEDDGCPLPAMLERDLSSGRTLRRRPNLVPQRLSIQDSQQRSRHLGFTNPISEASKMGPGLSRPSQDHLDTPDRFLTLRRSIQNEMHEREEALHDSMGSTKFSVQRPTLDKAHTAGDSMLRQTIDQNESYEGDESTRKRKPIPSLPAGESSVGETDFTSDSGPLVNESSAVRPKPEFVRPTRVLVPALTTSLANLPIEENTSPASDDTSSTIKGLTIRRKPLNAKPADDSSTMNSSTAPPSAEEPISSGNAEPSLIETPVIPPTVKESSNAGNSGLYQWPECHDDTANETPQNNASPGTSTSTTDIWINKNTSKSTFALSISLSLLNELHCLQAQTNLWSDFEANIGSPSLLPLLP